MVIWASVSDEVDAKIREQIKPAPDHDPGAGVFPVRLVGTVSYLFANGPVLRGGDTLGVSETERFRVTMTDRMGRMALTLEETGDAD